MKRITYILICLAAITTAAIGFRTMSKPVSSGALGFIIWAVSPYCYLAVMTKTVSQKPSTIAVLVFALLVGVFGVWALIDAMFIHLDAQGGLIYIFAPLWQWAFLILFTLPLYFLNQVKNA
jgi:uncharacterized membrane protein YuzA (DUF378 family)